MNILQIILLSLTSLLLITCKEQITTPTETMLDSGVIITFDDHYLDDWIKADSIFSKYNWKATFCISHFPELSKDYKNKILTLQNNGNEIAFHGTHHERAVYYLREHTVTEYINYEIIPGLSQMTEFGLNISCFAYPGGVRNHNTDEILFNYFKILRGTTFLALPPQEQKCFSVMDSNNKLVYAIGTDSHYKHMRISYIDSLLNYALKENKILLFYGHHIKADDSAKYVTSYSTLDYICNFVNQNKMGFYTLSEITNK